MSISDKDEVFSIGDNKLRYDREESLEFIFKGEVITLSAGDILNFETGEVERADNGTNKDN